MPRCRDVRWRVRSTTYRPCERTSQPARLLTVDLGDLLGRPTSSEARLASSLGSLSCVAAALAVIAGGCRDGEGSGCKAPPGCAGLEVCCTAQAACRDVICQGVTWTCSAQSGEPEWVESRPTSCVGSLGDGALALDGWPSDGWPDVGVSDTGGEADGGQSTKCNKNGVFFEASKPPVKCGRPVLTVRSKVAYPWIGGAIGAPSATLKWDTGPKISKDGSYYQWVFSQVAVPCKSGPYTFHFIKDAVNGNAKVGTVVAVCTP